MCRYVVYLGSPIKLDDLIYRPANSLIHQATEAMESPTRINADGFGVGWYHADGGPEPAMFKDITPAWNNANLRSISPRIKASCIFAHVRAAQRNDPVTRANCHPFEHHRLLWMHNGDVPGRGRLHKRVVARAREEVVARIRGNTDSELAFTLFQTYLDPPLDRAFPADELADALERTVRRLVGWHGEDGDRRPIALNFCVADGESVVACRFARLSAEVPSLRYATGDHFSCAEDGTCRMTPPRDRPGCAILASEQLSTPSTDWQAVDNGTLILVREDLRVEQRPLRVD